ncbi:MAG: hypothetical protein KKB37_14135 [Alphaproteobacteria bacterium]|nr:hypothetical protein [Alphaproteobacteria bacterium]
MLLVLLFLRDATAQERLAPCPHDATQTCQYSVVARSIIDERNRIHGILARPEIEKLRIGWLVNNAQEAFLQALKLKKPLVLLTHYAGCKECRRLIDKLSCPAIERFAGRAVFALSMRPLDAGGHQIASAAEVNAFPGIVVFAPDAVHLRVLSKTSGDKALPDFASFMENAIERYYLTTKQTEPAAAANMLTMAEMAAEYRIRGLPWPREPACGQ